MSQQASAKCHDSVKRKRFESERLDLTRQASTEIEEMCLEAFLVTFRQACD